MKKFVVTFFVCLLLQVVFSFISMAAETTPAATTVSQEELDYLPYMNSDWGKILLNMRWRYEHVDQDGINDTDAVTIRTRLGYQTPTFFGILLIWEPTRLLE